MGKDFYKLLQECAKKLPSELCEWDTETNFSKGELVLFHDQVLESLIDANGVHPCDDPDEESWKPCDKFEEPCLQELWECFLRPYIAYMVAHTAIRYGTYQAGARGLTKYSEDFREGTGIITVSRDELYDYKKELKDDAEDYLEEMLEWIKYEFECGNCPIFECVEYVRDTCNTHCKDVKKYRTSRVFHFKR